MKNRHALAAVALVLSWAAVATGQAQNTPIKGHPVFIRSSVAKSGDVGKRAHTNVRAFAPGQVISAESHLSTTVSGGQPPFAGLFYETPGSLACIYHLVAAVAGCSPARALNNAGGGSRAIAIVDAYDDPNAVGDLALYSAQFGLPAADFQVVYATGAQPANDLGWELEESLDIEMAHALAPHAKLYLVEAASSGLPDLLTAVQVASNLVAAAGGGEVSMSWSAGDFDGENTFDSYFTTPSVVYLAAAGDASGPGYPATSPNVVAVGGTTLRRDPSSGNFLGQLAWEDTGGGVTFNELTPSFQASLGSLLSGGRGVPDVAAVADPNTGVWVIDTGNTGACVTNSPWCVVGGTSAATPIVAAIENATGRFAESSQAELTRMYAGSTTAFADITEGFCGYFLQDAATKGWDFCSGVGSPR